MYSTSETEKELGPFQYNDLFTTLLLRKRRQDTHSSDGVLLSFVDCAVLLRFVIQKSTLDIEHEGRVFVKSEERKQSLQVCQPTIPLP